MSIENQRNSFFGQLPPVTKNLLVINLLVWLCGGLFTRMGINLEGWFGLVNWNAAKFGGIYSFHLWQPFTYMFLHANFWHMFCNMFAVLMFGPSIEQQWGSKRFLTYYMVSGIGAAIVQELVWMLTIGHAMSITIGASGAVFGLLFAFGWLFPEVRMFLLFIPIPIPSRVFVALYALFELSAGIYGSAADNVAHFAHLGGLLFGWLLLLYWKKTGKIGFRADYHDETWERIKTGFSKRFNGNKKRPQQNDFSRFHYQAPVSDNEATPTPDATTSQKAEKSTADAADTARLLDKIKRSGYESLTQEEKDRLFKH